MTIVPGPLGKYELLERLGMGGMAEVWKAFDTRLKRTVAIKFLHSNLTSDASLQERFGREAQAVASLHHPNIVQVYDFETADPAHPDSLAYMVMDYIEGPTLAQFLQTTSHQKQFPSPAQLVALFFSIAEAIDYAHRRGLLHRDIKPGNILLDQRHKERNPIGEPVLTDFGIVKILGSAPGTLTSSAAGTPLYISPEQAQGHPDTPASDLYSLGVILYETCTGLLPFQGDNIYVILQQHISKAPEPPEKWNPAISPELSAVILRSLAKDPSARYASAGDMVAAIASALSVPLPARSQGPLSSPGIFASEAVPVGVASGTAAIDQSAPTLLDHATANDEATFADSPAPSDAPTFLLDSNRSSSTGGSGPQTPIPQAAPQDISKITDVGVQSEPRNAENGAGSAVTSAPQPVTPVPVARRSNRRFRLQLVLIAVLILMLAGSGLTAILLLHRNPAAPGPVSVGTAFFASSGNGVGTENTGINDTFQVKLKGLSAPASGKQYYAWLLPDLSQSEGNPRALGALILQNGQASLSAPYVDPQHKNLVNTFSRFLVTEESSAPAPVSPSLDTTLWRYYAQIPQNSALADCQGNLTQLSVLCHLRHLLSGDPDLKKVNLAGGLNFWFLNNLQETQKWSQDAVDLRDGDDIRHRVVDILTTVDGQGCLQQDLQKAAPNENNVPDAPDLNKIALISLLNCSLTPDVPGYLAHIHNHLNAILQMPDITSAQKKLGLQIGTELNKLNDWLTDVRTDAIKLVGMNDTQLKTDGQATRGELNALMTNLLSGGTDPQTGQFQPGAITISTQLQQMATMEVQVYTQK